jgi:hypothetical protein
VERIHEMGEMVETVLGMWDGIQVHSSIHTVEKELEYEDLPTNTFTRADVTKEHSESSSRVSRSLLGKGREEWVGGFGRLLRVCNFPLSYTHRNPIRKRHMSPSNLDTHLEYSFVQMILYG